MCKIIDSENIFLHVPRCAGSVVITTVQSFLEDFKLVGLQDTYLNKGHVGVYPAIHYGVDIKQMKKHLILSYFVI